MSRLHLDAQFRFDLVRAPNAYQGGAEDLRMRVEDALAGDREVCAGVRHDAMRLAAAEPDASAVVEITHVAHAVPERAVWPVDLVQGGCVGPVVVRPRHDRAA